MQEPTDELANNIPAWREGSPLNAAGQFDTMSDLFLLGKLMAKCPQEALMGSGLDLQGKLLARKLTAKKALQHDYFRWPRRVPRVLLNASQC